LFQGKRGTLHPPQWQDGALHFLYEGADNVDRAVAINFSPAPITKGDRSAQFQIELAPRQSRQIRVAISISEEPKKATRKSGLPGRDSSTHISGDGDRAWLHGKTQLHTTSLLLNRVMDRSLRDLGVLRSQLAGVHYFAAGVPWFVALFGRDSIITVLQTLAYDPAIAEQTLRLLAQHQGMKIDPWREEEPGKI